MKKEKINIEFSRKRRKLLMQEIKCPKCGEVFQVDESGYAAIVKQVRDIGWLFVQWILLIDPNQHYSSRFQKQGSM